MADFSEDDHVVILKYPLNDSLDRLQKLLQEAEHHYNHVTMESSEACHDAVSKLLTTLMGEKSAFHLRSPASDKNVASELSRLFTYLQNDDFNYEHYRALIRLVIEKATDVDIWKAVLDLIVTSRSTPPTTIPPSFDGTPVKSTSSSQKGSEQTRELVNLRIFEEIRGCTFRGIEGFFDKYFEGKDWSSKADAICQRVLAPDSDGNWAQFPDPPTQNNVLTWWFRLQEDLLLESRGIYYTTASKADLIGSKAERQVNLLLRARSTSLSQVKHNWRDILVVGELKKSKEEIRTKDTLLQMSCYVRDVFAAQPTRRFIHAFAVCGAKMEAWMFDRSGPYSSGVIDIYKDSRRFFQMLVGYTMMSDEELGLDTFIARDEGSSKLITVRGRPGTSEETVLRLGEMLSFQHAIVCRGTTCFLADDGQVEGVAKFSWVSDKRRPEVELLELAGQKNVQGVARIIGHSTITSIADMRCGLTFDNKRHNFKSTTPSTASSFHQSQPLTEPDHLDIHQKSSSRKRRSPDKGMQASKRSRSINQLSRATQQDNELAFSIQSVHEPSLFNRNGEEPYDNRVLRCLVISPAGRPIYKYRSPLELLMALRDAIKAHRSLYLDGNILHRDISENNIIITNPDKADGHSGMLIDLDLAKEVGSARSGARHQTGTMEFMAIEVLLNIDHTYRHDLESFFYVLIWQCAHHGWELKPPQTSHQLQEKSGFSMLKKWYTGNYEEIATYKRGNMEAGGFERILMKEFPPWFDWVKPLCRNIRRILFPHGVEGLIVGTPQDPKRLYDPIIKAYDDAIALIETEYE
ncbi:hypothetical protein RJ035_001594 [Blastomyces gilchristii]